LGVVVGDGPAGCALEAYGEGGVGRHDDGLDMPVLKDLLPGVFELIGIGEIVEQGLAIEVGAAVDEDGSGGVELPDQVAAPVVVVEDGASGRMVLEKTRRLRWGKGWPRLRAGDE